LESGGWSVDPFACCDNPRPACLEDGIGPWCPPPHGGTGVSGAGWLRSRRCSLRGGSIRWCEPAVMADAAGAGDARPDARRRVPRWRRILSVTLLVLGCILTPIAIHTVWIHHTLLDTDQYVETVGPLASNHDVQNALANRVTNTLYNNSNIDARLKNALPPSASFAAPVVANALKNFVHNVALRVVQSPKFEQLWKNLNRRVHTRLVNLLRGEGKFVNKQGQVAIDIQPIIDKANTAL